MKMRISNALRCWCLRPARQLSEAQEPAELRDCGAAEPGSAPHSRPVTNTAPPATAGCRNQGPIDPKSSEAAEQVVQNYGALIEEGRFNEADKLLGRCGARARNSHSDFSRIRTCKTGVPRRQGRCGRLDLSSTVPVGPHGGASGLVEAPAQFLRRVNDVPGSTEAQRRWHIERIEWGETP